MPDTTTPQTFTELLDGLLATDAGRPLITFYDDATGERVELSVATYANWVAKTASLLVEECDLERGQRLRVELPTHWLGPVFLGAAWTAGLVVELPAGEDSPPGAPPDAVVCGPAGLDQWAPRAQEVEVIASALLPLGVRFPEPPPAGVRDFGVEVWSQPDAFIAFDPPTGEDEAMPGTSQARLWTTAAAGSLLTDGGRLLTAANPASPSGLAVLTEVLGRRGSLILVARPDADRLDGRFADERATHRA